MSNRMTAPTTPCFPADPEEGCEVHACHEHADGLHHHDGPVSLLCVCGALDTGNRPEEWA